jgi:hypothetical protein
MLAVTWMQKTIAELNAIFQTPSFATPQKRLPRSLLKIITILLFLQT